MEFGERGFVGVFGGEEKGGVWEGGILSVGVEREGNSKMKRWGGKIEGRQGGYLGEGVI